MGRGSKVLVMDDADTIRGLLADMLREIDTVGDVIEAEDAPTALRLALEHGPDIAILDIHVPGDEQVRDGIDVLRHVKEVNPQTKVFILTSHPSEHHRQECRRAGADDFYDKSREFEELLDRIAEYQSHSQLLQ